MAAVLAAAISLAEGCGNPVGTGMTSAVPVSGDWMFSLPATPGASQDLPPLTAGSLVVSGNSVSAYFLPGVVSGCSAYLGTGIVLTGTVGDSKIAMTSTAWGGTVLSLTGTVSSDGQTISGTWSGKGGCADGQSGTLNLQYVPPVTGTWTGVLSALPGVGTLPPTSLEGLAGATVTFQFQQSATPVQYSFPLSGTVSVSGSTCGFSSGTLIQINPMVPLAPSSITGPLWNTEATMNDGSQMIATGARATFSGQWTAIVDVIGGACDGAEAQAKLTGP